MGCPAYGCLDYVLLYGAILWVGYSIVVGLGIYLSVKSESHRLYYFEEVKKVIEELIHILHNEEEILMSKQEKDLYIREGNGGITEGVGNTLSLTDLLTQKPTEENYEEVLDILIKLARKLYVEYKFLIAKSPNEKEQSNFLQLVSNWSENPELHQLAFAKAVNYGIETPLLQMKFAEKVANGEVLDLGEDVVVITDDGTNQPPTGVSPINSGIEGGEIAFIISFVHRDNYDGWKENNLPKEDETE